MSPVSVYAVFASTEEAERIGRQMLEEGLAACINILGPCHSIYRWQGEIKTAEEVPAIFKTTREQSFGLIERIVELHSYEVPAVTSWPILELPSAYGEWVQSSVGGR